MCGNRVEELESRVKELEASVEGLTDELVECKVRLQEMEGAVDEDLGLPESQSAAESDGVASESAGDDIQVPEPGESTDGADTSNTEDAESGDNTEDSGSDIIVA